MPTDRGDEDATITGRVSAWFRDNARALPWRTEPRDPYHALVSELMLQQTQVSRVLEKFGVFVARFPTATALAEAPEAEVLAAWSGLGYYRRARLLHGAARAIADRHDGAVPRDVDELRGLPGIGRYTAGAIASIAFGLPEPIVDGNVARVLLRLEGRDAASDDRQAIARVWERAESLVRAADDPGTFNEGLMELGAVVCTPRGPSCDVCPLADRCAAYATGRTEDIPRPKARAKRRNLYCASAVVRDRRGRLLVEQRAEEGLWARMWQAPTLERDDRRPGVAELSALGLAGLRRAGSFVHQTTHRIVRFDVYEARVGRAAAPGVWRTRRQIESLAISNAQRRILLGPGPRNAGTDNPE